MVAEIGDYCETPYAKYIPWLIYPMATHPQTIAKAEAKAKVEAAERDAKAKREAEVAALVNAGAGQRAEPVATVQTSANDAEETKPAPKIKKYLVRWRLDASDLTSHIHCSWEEVRDLKYCFGNTRLSTALTGYHKRKERGAYDTREDDMWEEEGEIGEDDPLKYCLNPKLIQVERVVQIGEDLFGDESESEDEDEEQSGGSEADESMESVEDDIFDAKAAKSSDPDADAEAKVEAEGKNPMAVKILAKLNRNPLKHQVLVKWAGLGYEELSWEYWADLSRDGRQAAVGATEALEGVLRCAALRCAALRCVAMCSSKEAHVIVGHAPSRSTIPPTAPLTPPSPPQLSSSLRRVRSSKARAVVDLTRTRPRR